MEPKQEKPPKNHMEPGTSMFSKHHMELGKNMYQSHETSQVPRVPMNDAYPTTSNAPPPSYETAIQCGPPVQFTSSPPRTIQCGPPVQFTGSPPRTIQCGPPVIQYNSHPTPNVVFVSAPQAKRQYFNP